MWGSIARLFGKNDNNQSETSLENVNHDDSELNAMDKYASHQDMDTIEAKQVNVGG